MYIILISTKDSREKREFCKVTFKWRYFGQIFKPWRFAHLNKNINFLRKAPPLNFYGEFNNVSKIKINIKLCVQNCVFYEGVLQEIYSFRNGSQF